MSAIGLIGSDLLSLTNETAACWVQAIETFNRDLTKDPRKKIDASASTSIHNFPTCKLDDLLLTTNEVSRNNQIQRRGIQSKLEQAVVTINQYAAVIDVLIQQQPNITAIVWGVVRLLISVAAREVETANEIGEALVEVIGNLGRWQAHLQLFYASPRVCEISAQLFSQVINFLVRAKAYYQKPWRKRTAKVGFTRYKQKLNDIMVHIQRHSATLEHEISVARDLKRSSEWKVQETFNNAQTQEISKQEDFRLDTRKSLCAISQETENIKSIAFHFHESQQEASLMNKFSAAMSFFHRQWDLISSPIPQRAEGTCTWIFKDERYQAWIGLGYSKPLVIHGRPGTGKTVLANYLYQTSTTKVTVVHFFQSVMHKALTAPTPFTASIVEHLLQNEHLKSLPRYEVALDMVSTLAAGTKNPCDHSLFHRLWSIIYILVEEIPDFTIIVDALDECVDDPNRDVLLEHLLDLAVKPNSRIIILSRNNPWLSKFLGESISIELGAAEVGADTMLYVTREMKRDEALQRLPEQVSSNICTSSEGMFLWARMAIEALKRARTLKAQMHCLSECPPGLYPFYETLLSSGGSTLDNNELKCRENIFLALIGASRALTCQELSVVLALRVDGSALDREDLLLCPEKVVYQICWPLATISKGRVHLVHESVKSFLLTRKKPSPRTLSSEWDDSNAFLARKCFSMLSQQEYQDPAKVGALLRKNVYEEYLLEPKIRSDELPDEDPSFYQYAAIHWSVHLTSVSTPDNDLVRQAANFLKGYEYVTWSEYLFQKTYSQGSALEVQGKLLDWTGSLPDASKRLIPLDEYFTGPYRALATEFELNGRDKILKYLCLFQLGQFYNLSTRNQEAYEVKMLVAEGLVELLGDRNPLSMRAVSALAYEYLIQGRLREAEETFKKLAEFQRDAIGKNKTAYFESLQREGMAQYFMTKFLVASQSLIESLSGFLDTSGPTSFSYLLSKLTYGYVLEYEGELSRAFLDFETIWKYRLSVLGSDDAMAQFAQHSMAANLWKAGRPEEADEHSKQSLRTRQRVFGSTSIITIDTTILRIVICRETGQMSEANELIERVSGPGVMDHFFERVCQVNHLRALLQIDEGQFESPRAVLQSLLDRAFEMKTRNRSLLWVRLDLATILRNHGRGDEALTLFDDLVASTDTSSIYSEPSYEKPQAPADWAIAEQALRLVRKNQFHEAEQLLANKMLKWVREEDFWLVVGGPYVDLAWSKPLPLQGLDRKSTT